MSKSTRGKTYGYQAPESTKGDAVADERKALVAAFGQFLDAVTGREASGATGEPGSSSSGAYGGSSGESEGGTTSSGANGGSSGESEGGTTSSGAYGGSPGGTTTTGTTGGAPSTGTTTGGAPSTGTTTGGAPSTGTTTGTTSPPGTGTDGQEAFEMSIYSQREAFRADRARENARRAQRKETQPLLTAGGPVVAPNPHQSDSNRAPVTPSKEFAPGFGAAGRSDKPTKEVVAVPATQRPENVPVYGTVAGLRPIDAYWGSYGTAVERAAARARVTYKTLESVIGTDDRQRVSDTTVYPYRCICSLLITASTGATFLGTAWLVGPRLLATAGHNIFMSDEGGWAREIEVIPGRDVTARPFGSTIARDFRSVIGWTQDGDSDYDYGAILLPEDARYGDQLGWFGYANRDDAYLRGITVNISGYPGDGGPAGIDGSQWTDNRVIQDVQARQITYVADTFGGQSGAPVWEMTADGSRYGVAVHTFGTSVHNGGTRITGDVFDNFVSWAGQAP